MRRVLVLLLVTSVAHAQDAMVVPEDAEAARAQLDALFEKNQYSAVLRFLDAAIAQHPGDADFHYRYALVLIGTNQRKEALAELEAALRLVPDEPEILFQLGVLHSLMGEDGQAKKWLEQAQKLAPAHEGVETELAAIATRERIRSRPRPDVPPDSPARVAHDAVSRFAAGDAAGAISQLTSKGFQEYVFREMRVSPKDRASFLAGFNEGLTGLSRQSQLELVGYEITGEPEVSGDRAVVHVQLLTVQVISKDVVAKQLAVLASPAAEKLMGSNLDVFRGLEPADRRAMLERMVGTRQTLLLQGKLQLVREAGGWRIDDGTVGEVGSFEVSLRRLLVESTPRTEPEAKQRDWRRIGEGVGRLTVVVVAVGLVIWMFRRRKRK